MVKKGDKSTQDSATSAEAIVEQLTSIGDITSKKMFGGQGIFHAGKMFGIFYPKGVIFMKSVVSNVQTCTLSTVLT